jgi:hypothetical protein
MPIEYTDTARYATVAAVPISEVGHMRRDQA